MRTLFSIITSLLIISCNSSEKFYEEGIKLGDQEKFEEAIQMFDKAIEKNPKFLNALLDRGYYKMSLKKDSLAIIDFEKALKIDHSNTLALYDIGCCKANLKDFSASVKYFNQASETKGGQTFCLDLIENPSIDDPKVKYDVKAVEIIYLRGCSYAKIDSLKNSYFDFMHCIKNRYMVSDSYYWISCLYFMSDENDLACEALNKAVMYGYKDINSEHLKICMTK